MKKLSCVWMTGLVCFAVFALIFLSIDFAQAQMKTQGSPPGKGKDKPNPNLICNVNLNCEYEEWDSSKNEERQPCADCLPQVYGSLSIIGSGPQIAGYRRTTSDAREWRPAKAYQIKYDGNLRDDTGGYSIQWESLDLDQASHGVVIGDIDNDGLDEIAAIDTFVTTIGKGKKRESYFNHDILIFEEGSGTEEPVRLPLVGEHVKLSIDGILIANVDSDDDKELIVYKSGTITGHFEVYKIFDNNRQYSLQRVYYNHDDPNAYIYRDGGIWGLEVGNVDGDPENEILLSRFNSTKPFILNFDTTHPNYWRPVEDIPIEVDEINPSEAKFEDGTINFNVIRIADTNNNGRNEIIAGTNNDRLYIWEINEFGTRYVKIFSTDDLTPNDNNFTWALDVGDVDGDSAKEIVVGIGAGTTTPDPLRVFRYNGNTWTQDSLLGEGGRPFGLNDLRISDLDGTGPAEIITGQNGLTIYRYDPTSNSFLTLYNYALGSSFKTK
ncbi:FG-GAP repeat domain-containing protein [Acidobacteriota bacterium]